MKAVIWPLKVLRVLIVGKRLVYAGQLGGQVLQFPPKESIQSNLDIKTTFVLQPKWSL